MILCKQKKRPPVIWVQPLAHHAAVSYNPSVNMGYYSSYSQSDDFNVLPPAYQQENVSVVSSEK